MNDIRIYFNGENPDLPLRAALSKITDSWVDDGECCAQTTIDLRDALITVLGRYDSLRDAAKELLKQKESFGIVSELDLEDLEKEIKQFN
jgi:hypothetical protein